MTTMALPPQMLFLYIDSVFHKVCMIYIFNFLVTSSQFSFFLNGEAPRCSPRAHSAQVAYSYLHSIHFHSFPFLYFKTSNQGYLIPFHSILFHSFPLLKYIPFLSIPLLLFLSIPFHFLPFPYELPSEALGNE